MKHRYKTVRTGKERWDVQYTSTKKGGEVITESIEVPVKRFTTSDGRKYAIPFDPDTGLVPIWAIYDRYFDVESGTRTSGKRNILIDNFAFSNTVHKPLNAEGWTPEELFDTGWWEFPNESDLDGVDDPTSLVCAPLKYSSKKGNQAAGKISILTPDKDLVRTVLENNFTGGEIVTAAGDGLVITTGIPGDPNAGGYYRRISPTNRVPFIMLRPGFDEDTVSHEMSHHLREVDKTREGYARCPYPVGEDGYAKIPSSWARDYSNLEEAATVCEATLRTRKPCENPTAYFLYGENGRRRAKEKQSFAKRVEGVSEDYDHDRGILVGKGKPLRGKRAINRVNKMFAETEISTMKMDSAMTAKDFYDYLGKNGKLPEPESKKVKSDNRKGLFSNLSKTLRSIR